MEPAGERARRSTTRATYDASRRLASAGIAQKALRPIRPIVALGLLDDEGPVAVEREELYAPAASAFRRNGVAGMRRSRLHEKAVGVVRVARTANAAGIDNEPVAMRLRALC